MAEPPGVNVVPAMTTKPEGFTERVVPPTTAVGVGEAGAGLAGFWFCVWFGGEFGLGDPSAGLGGDGLPLIGGVDVEDEGIVTGSGAVLGPPGDVKLGDGDADEEGDVCSTASVVIGEKNCVRSCKDIGGSKTPWKATPQVAQAGSRALTPPGISSCDVQRLVCGPRSASVLHFLVHVH
jgi:hypothetical protein